MSLNKELEAMREKSWGSWPVENRAIVERANRELAESGILDKVVKTGEPAPDFSLFDTDGTKVSLAGLLGQGPAVVAFYRGYW